MGYPIAPFPGVGFVTRRGASGVAFPRGAPGDYASTVRECSGGGSRGRRPGLPKHTAANQWGNMIEWRV